MQQHYMRMDQSYPVAYSPLLYRVSSDYYNSYEGPGSIDYGSQCFCTAGCDDPNDTCCGQCMPEQLCPYGCDMSLSAQCSEQCRCLEPNCTRPPPTPEAPRNLPLSACKRCDPNVHIPPLTPYFGGLAWTN